MTHFIDIQSPAPSSLVRQLFSQDSDMQKGS